MSPGYEALILHQYDVSPFSEKVRVALGIKAMRWSACDQPMMMPKPEMVRLTGGFRRIPGLQVGADLYFDSQFILEELDRRSSSPSVFAGSGVGLSGAFTQWSDNGLFLTIAGLLFAGDWDYDEAFLEDRGAMIGRPIDPAARAAAAPTLIPELRMQLDLIEAQLADGRAFLTGPSPNAVDATLYGHLFFARWSKGWTRGLIDAFPGLRAWESRVAAIGHGARGEDVGREAAIAIAREDQGCTRRCCDDG